jgi:hypothetical protein
MTIRRLAIALPLVLAGWIGVMALVMLASDAAPAAVVVFPADDFLERMPEGAVISRTRFTLTVRSDTPGLGRALYRAGALLVLPAGLTGCLPLPSA